MKVIVLGASNNPKRYSYRAQQALLKHGYKVIPVTNRYTSVQGIAARGSLKDISEPVDTVTVYVNPRNVEKLAGSFIAVRPRRVIFNPGSESNVTIKLLEAAEITVQKACTLVLLSTNQFEA